MKRFEKKTKKKLPKAVTIAKPQPLIIKQKTFPTNTTKKCNL
jgi:hypothetical protein